MSGKKKKLSVIMGMTDTNEWKREKTVRHQGYGGHN